ncbi:MAG: hypothetical protein JSS81_05800 [Acidobacteria bacterium]|nr:hypothetical protein [Acidobacteriota bacterium]
MSERDYRNYFGQTANPFVLVSEFELTPLFLRIAFDGFASIETFDAGAEPLSNLRREFRIDGDEFSDLKRNHSDVFDSIRNNCLKIANAPENYEFTYLNLLTVRWVLIINATSERRDDLIVRTKTAPEYHLIIAENLQLIAQVLTIAWEYGKTKDEWLRSLVAVSGYQISYK